MLFKPYPGKRKELNLLTGIAPIFRIDRVTNKVHLIGTGFWVTKMGHLVTAWHVVQENIDSNGVDRGPIFAIQTFTDLSIVVRSFRKSDKHPQFDLALSETVTAAPLTDRPTIPVPMSLDELTVEDPVFSFAVLGDDQIFENEKMPGHIVYRYRGEISDDFLTGPAAVKFAVRLSFGYVSAIFEKMRDSVMLPFPCIQTDVPIYGGNSGGPLFDVRGRICAVHCTSFGGNDVAFHIPIQGVLQLRTSVPYIEIKDTARPHVSILELAVLQRVLFEPPMLDADKPVRSVLRWLWYAMMCFARREFPSMRLHFATTCAMKNSR